RISNQLTKAIKQQNALLANDAKLQLLKVQTEKVKASLDATSGDMDMPVFIDDISGDEYE
ncbi:small subunit of terminase, partial [Enterococcus faecalis]